MENTDNKSISVDLNAEQYAFLTNWQKTHEQELGIEVPLGAMARKAIDIAMKSQNKREERPARESKDGRDGYSPRGTRPSNSSFGAKRPSFGAPRLTSGGSKFNMMGPRNKSKSFDK